MISVILQLKTITVGALMSLCVFSGDLTQLVLLGLSMNLCSGVKRFYFMTNFWKRSFFEEEEEEGGNI